MIKFSTPDITTAEVKKVEEAIDTRWLSLSEGSQS